MHLNDICMSIADKRPSCGLYPCRPAELLSTQLDLPPIAKVLCRPYSGGLARELAPCAAREPPSRADAMMGSLIE